MLRSVFDRSPNIIRPGDPVDSGLMNGDRFARALGEVAIAAMAMMAGAERAGAQVEVVQNPGREVQAEQPKAAQKRTIEYFGFEEPENPYPVPKYWVRLLDTPNTPRPGFPRFNEAAFDFDVSHTGGASLRLPTRGGSTALRLLAGTIPVFPQGDYAVSAVVRTAGVKTARAYLTARFLDQNQRPVPGGEYRSEAIISEGVWTPVTVELIGVREDVAFLQIELELLQPKQQPGAGEAPVRRSVKPIETEDLNASAWFDDVSVSQIPRVEIKTTEPGNVFSDDRTPVVVMTIRDLVGERLTARLRVLDVNGREADRADLPVNASGRPMEWEPKINEPGWYRVLLDVASEERVLTKEQTTLVRLEARPGRRHGEFARFGIQADQSESWQNPSIRHMQSELGFGHMTIPVWGDGVETAGIGAAIADIGPMLDELLARGVSVTLCMPRLPSDLAIKHSLDPNDPLAIALADEKDWVPLMDPAFDRYGQQITRWQMGRVASRDSLPGEGGDEAFWGPSFPVAVERLHRSLSRLVPGPQVMIPWRSDLDLTSLTAGASVSSRPAGAMMTVPFWAERESIESMARAYAELPDPKPELTLMPQYSTAGVSEMDRVITLARQIVESWRLFGQTPDGVPASRFSANAPWKVRGSRRRHVSPTPDLAVWGTMANHLAGRRIVGEYPAPEGVRCYILAPIDSVRSARGGQASAAADAAAEENASTGALMLWNESADTLDPSIAVYVAANQARLIDPVGRSRRLASPHPLHPNEDVQRVVATAVPMFIEGIDARLASLIASFRVDPDFLPAVAIEHELEMRLTNPWPTTLTGRLQIIPPGSSGRGTEKGERGGASRSRRQWTIAPDGIVTINIPPGQTQVIPFAATLPAADDAGEKQISAILRLDSDQHDASIRLDAQVNVGLADIGLTTKVEMAPNIDGPNVVLTLQIVNRGAAERLLRVQVRVPGIPTRELVLANPTPGETLTKRFVFKDAATRLQGKRLQISVSDSESAARLNASVLVP